MTARILGARTSIWLAALASGAELVDVGAKSPIELGSTIEITKSPIALGSTIEITAGQLDVLPPVTPANTYPRRRRRTSANAAERRKRRRAQGEARRAGRQK